MTAISDRLLKQRLRNRIIEVIDMLVDSDDAIKKIGTDEILECWFDNVDDEKLGFYDSPVFTQKETELVTELHQIIDESCELIPTTWKPSDVASCGPWGKIVTKANVAFEVFKKRGCFDEEKEITFDDE